MSETEFQTLNRQKYFVEGVPVITVPLERRGYKVRNGADIYIFVNSKLPKAERRQVARELLRMTIKVIDRTKIQ